MSLVSEFRLTLCPSIVQMVNQVQGTVHASLDKTNSTYLMSLRNPGPVNPEDTHSVLLKDAGTVYRVDLFIICLTATNCF